MAIVGDLPRLIFAKGEEPLYWELGAVVMHIQHIADVRVKHKNNT